MSRRVRKVALFIPPSCRSKVRQAVDLCIRLGALDAALCVWGVGDPLEDRGPEMTVWDA